MTSPFHCTKPSGSLAEIGSPPDIGIHVRPSGKVNRILRDKPRIRRRVVPGPIVVQPRSAIVLPAGEALGVVIGRPRLRRRPVGRVRVLRRDRLCTVGQRQRRSQRVGQHIAGGGPLRPAEDLVDPQPREQIGLDRRPVLLLHEVQPVI